MTTVAKRRYEERLRVIKAMHEIVLSMNDECAYYDRWVYVVPDCPCNEDFEDIAEDEDFFRVVVDCFKEIMNEYLESGLFIGDKLY